MLLQVGLGTNTGLFYPVEHSIGNGNIRISLSHSIKIDHFLIVLPPRLAADRADDKVKFTDDALETILNVLRVFLPLVLKGCVEWARENNCELITAAEIKIINDKRSKEKAKK